MPELWYNVAGPGVILLSSGEMGCALFAPVRGDVVDEIVFRVPAVILL